MFEFLDFNIGAETNAAHSCCGKQKSMVQYRIVNTYYEMAWITDEVGQLKGLGEVLASIERKKLFVRMTRQNRSHERRWRRGEHHQIQRSFLSLSELLFLHQTTS